MFKINLEFPEKIEKIIQIPTVFIHGIVETHRDWSPFILQTCGNQFHKVSLDYEFKSNLKIIHKKPNLSSSVWIVSYYVNNRIRELVEGNLRNYAIRLRQLIQYIIIFSNTQKINLVGHSMGGILARYYMCMGEQEWNSVHKILCLGSPHEGIPIPHPTFMPQVEDLKKGSHFLMKMNRKWNYYNSIQKSRWGVIGSINPYSITNLFRSMAYKTDSGGMGSVVLSSCIPFGEWKEAIQMPGLPAYNTKNFSYRLFLEEHHNHLLNSKATHLGINWLVEE